VSREARLGVVFALNGALLGGLAAVGVVAHSLGVLSAAGDYLADALAIGLSILTVRLARRSPTAKRTYGYERTTILAALANAALVVAVMAAVVVAAIGRLVDRVPRVHGAAVIIVSAIAAVVMLIGALLLRGDQDLNMRSVLLDTGADAAAATAVAVTGVVIVATGGFYWLDPSVALVVAVIIGYRAVALLSEIADVLMESTPKGIDLHAVEAAIRAGGEVSEVHDLHIWGLSSEVLLLSAHVVLVGHPTLEEAQSTVERIKAELASRFAIAHATLETECEACATPDPHVGVTRARQPG
jgi:cobalt-zinc-cadmium efflux system protein